MKRLDYREWLQSKVLWGYFLMILLIPFALMSYNYSKEDTTYQQLKQFVEGEQRLIAMHREINRYEKEINPSFDADGYYDQLLIESGKTLMEWSNRIFNENYYTYEQELKLSQLYQQIENLERYLPLTYGRQEELKIHYQRAEIMKEHNFPHLEKEYPTSSVLFIKDLSEWLFNLFTVVMFIVLFVYQYYQILEPQVDLLLMTPIHRGRIARRFFYKVMVILSILCLYFLVIGAYILFKDGIHYLNYPLIINEPLNYMLIPVWKYLVMRLIIWYGTVTGILILIQLLSLIIKKAEINLLLVLLFILSIQTFFKNSPLMHLHHIEQIFINPKLLVVIGSYVAVFILWLVINISPMNWIIQDQLRRKNSNRIKEQDDFKRMKFIPKHWRFELVKRLRQPYIKRLLVMMCLFIFGSYAYIVYQTVNIENAFQIFLEEKVNFNQQKIVEMQLQVELAMKQSQVYFNQEYASRKNKALGFENWFESEYPDHYEGIKELVSHFKKEAEEYQRVLDKLEQNNFTSEDLIQFRENYYDRRELDFEQSKQVPSKSWLAAKEQTEIIKAKGLKPLLLGTLLLDQYHQYYVNPNEHIQWSYSTVYSMYLLMEKHIHILIVLLLIVTLFSSLSEERFWNNHLEWLFLLPIKRLSIYWNKYFYNLIFIIGTFFFGVIMYVLLSGIVGGLGQLDYPIATFLPSSSGKMNGIFALAENLYFSMTPILDVVRNTLLMIFFSLAFINSLTLGLSIWIKQRYSLLLTVLLICGIGYYGCYVFIDYEMVRYLPFIYLNAFSISDGWFSYLADSTSINYLNGIVVLVVWTIIMTFFGWISFKFKWEKGSHKKWKLN